MSPRSSSLTTFSEFLDFYRGEHAKPGTRNVHVLGTSLFITAALTAIVTGRWWLVLAGIVTAYAFAWSSHFFIEKNKPATFKYPVYSLMADFVLWWEAVSYLVAGDVRHGAKCENEAITKKH